MKTFLKFFFIVVLCSFASPRLFAETILIGTQSNTSCSNPNGLVSATVDGGTQGYSFEWHAGADLTGPLLSTNAVASNLAAGIYTVKVTDNSTSIVTGIVSAIVGDAIVIPQVFVQVVSNVTSCITPNGSVTAIVDGPVSDYTFKWFEGSVVWAGPIVSVNASASGLSALTYSVLVEHITSGCITIASVSVADETVLPLVFTNASHVTSCISPNGAVTAFVNGPSSDYTFEWFAGPVAFSGPLLSVNPTVQFLSEGMYTVAVTDINSGCMSMATAMVFDTRSYPTVSIDVVSNNTSCTSPNGSLAAIVNGPVSDYTFEWYEAPVFSGPVLSLSSTIDQLPAGTYAVLVTNNSSGCQSIVYAMVQEACELGFSATNSLAAGNEKSTISYYPNPTKGTLWVQPKTTTGFVVIMDRMGRVVRKQKSDASRTPFSFDLSDQPPGQYIIKFTSSQGSSQYHIIKE